MNKSDLIDALAQRRGLTHKEADLVVHLIFDGMTEALRKGERIEIRGFGSLIVKEYSSYTGRNPKTGDQVHVPPKRLPFFKVGKELKERVDSEAVAAVAAMALGAAEGTASARARAAARSAGGRCLDRDSSEDEGARDLSLRPNGSHRGRGGGTSGAAAPR